MFIFCNPLKSGSARPIFLGLSMPPKTDFVSKDLDRTKINSGWAEERSGKFDEMKA
jgi:hypothetical protein